MNLQTIGFNMQISVEIPSDLEKELEQVPEPDRQHFLIRAIRGQLHQDQLNNPQNTLNDVARIISERAKQRGLTEEKLEQMLTDAR